MRLTRIPGPALRPFVKQLWASEQTSAGAVREHVLPTGRMHLVFRLSDHPLRVFDGADDRIGRTVGLVVVGGARSSFYVRDVSQPMRSVGAELHPGAAEVLFGAPANELAERHTPLADLWGPAANEARQRLLEAGDPGRALDLFEALLRARLPAVRGLHPAVARALGRFATGADVGHVVADSGYSHRRFIALFRGAVGLTPKTYCRLLRFQRVLDRGSEHASWVDVALAAGYSDQPHLNREFRHLAGLSPGGYRRAAPDWSHHVPILTR
jgi:AraC-like DNA-binding protein